MASNFGFDLKTLEVFVQVVETGNVTAAGRQLGMSQSSISQILAQLEEAMRVQLMDRSVRPMAVTTAGRYFYDRAQTILGEANAAAIEMRKADYQRLRHVKMALVDSVMTAVGKPLIEVIQQRTQNWTVVTGQSHLHGHMLSARQADIIISDDPLDDYPKLDRYRLLREPFVLAVPNDYYGSSRLDKVLERHTLIRYSANTLIGKQVEQYLRRERHEQEAHLQLDNSFAVVSAVASGIGCSITTPLCLFQSGIRDHQVKLLPLEASLNRSLQLACRENELGDLPAVIARDCRRILMNSYFTEVSLEYPWLRKAITIGD